MKREDIVKKKFSRMVMGYSPMQVDAFLDEIVAEFSQNQITQRETVNANDVELARLKATLARITNEHEALQAEVKRLNEENATLRDENHKLMGQLKILAREIQKHRQE